MKRIIPVALLAVFLAGSINTTAWADDKRDDVLRRRAEINALKAHGVYHQGARHYENRYHRQPVWQGPPYGNAWGYRKHKSKRMNRWQFNRLHDRFHNRFGY
jgi:hypothetical protein